MMTPNHRPSESEYVKRLLEPVTHPVRPHTAGNRYKIDYAAPSSPYKQPVNFVRTKLKARRELDTLEREAMGPGTSSTPQANRYRAMRVRPVSDMQYKRWARKTYVESTPIPDDVLIARWPECKKHIAGPGQWIASPPKQADAHTLGGLVDTLQKEKSYLEHIRQAEQAFAHLVGAEDEPAHVLQVTPPPPCPPTPTDCHCR